MIDDLQVTGVTGLIMDISLGLSIMFFVQPKPLQENGGKGSLRV